MMLGQGEQIPFIPWLKFRERKPLPLKISHHQAFDFWKVSIFVFGGQSCDFWNQGLIRALPPKKENLPDCSRPLPHF